MYVQRWPAWLVPHETAAVSAQILCTPYNHAPCHFMQSHIRKVYACLAVTCHLHFWQNDRGLLRAAAVTRGWNGYKNKSQHRKSTLEKKILPPLLQGFEPATFQSWVRRSNHWAILAPLSQRAQPHTITGEVLPERSVSGICASSTTLSPQVDRLGALLWPSATLDPETKKALCTLRHKENKEQ